MLSNTFADNGNSIIVMLELNPTDRISLKLDAVKVTSSYGRNNIKEFVDRSDVIYVSDDTKKTSEWMKRTRVQFPVGNSFNGSNENIASGNNSVNTYYDVRHSLDIEDDFFFSGYAFSDDESSSILEEGMEALKHKSVDTASVRRIANKIRSEFSSGINLNTLTDNLTKAFA